MRRIAADVTDITIVGAGPAGLAAAFWAGMRRLEVRVVDALPEPGGQLTALYPEKPIYDVVGHPRVLARELVDALVAQGVTPFATPLLLGTTVETLEHEADAVVLGTSAGPLRSRAVIVAAGHGAVEPRRLPPEDADLSVWEGRGVHYVVRRKAELAGRRVLVVGGGDSALDWALELLDTAAHVTLVHRRARFRALPATVAAMEDAVAAGRMALRTDTVVAAAHGDERLRGVTLRRRDASAPREDAAGGHGAAAGPADAHRAPAGFERIDADAILLQLGHVSRLGPLAGWGFEADGGSIAVDGLGATGIDGVWACGDVVAGPGRLKLIATGFGEAATVVAQAARDLRPDEPLQPEYSTDRPPPGAALTRD